jgi:cardiolipin synthase
MAQAMKGAAKMQIEKQKIFNVPNALTLLRLLLIPVYWVLMMGRNDEMSALAVFVVASLTDLLDGYIARKYNLITDVGKLFDPLADKLMVLSVLLTLVLKGIAPLAVMIILLVKELIMMIGGYLMLRRKVVVYSRPIGKSAQFIIVLALLACFFHKDFADFPLHLALLWAGVALTIAALAYYTKACLAALKAGKPVTSDMKGMSDVE